MTPIEKLTGVYLFVKDWIDREPVKARAIFVALAGLAARFGVRLDAEWVLAIVGLLGAAATRGARGKVVTVAKADRMARRAAAVEAERHAAHVSAVGTTTIHQTVKKTPVRKKPAPKEAGQAWMPFLLGVVVCVIVLALLGRIAL